MRSSKMAAFWLAMLALPAPLAAQTIVLRNVNVVPMDRERVMRNQTVVATDGRIVAIGRAAAIPPDAQVIDGKGAWLSPGLADMHVHSETPEELAIYLRHGITTMLAMGGARQRLVGKTAPRANRGEIASPHVYTSFLVDGTAAFNGFVLQTPEQARAIVGMAKAQGYDFIKLYVGLTPAVFTALAEEARLQSMPLVGHGIYTVRIDRQLAAGQALIAHLEEFFYSYLFPAGQGEGEDLPPWSRVADAIALLKRHDATVTADPLTYRTIALLANHPQHKERILARPEMATLLPERRLEWRRSPYFDKTAKLLPRADFMRRMVKAFADSGVRLILGTDAPTIPGLFPGVSLHDQLAELRAAGLSPYQALATATAMPGDFIAKTKGGVPFGRIVVGNRADLVLTRDNPLSQQQTLRLPIGVMTAGKWRDATALEALAAGVAADYHAAETARGRHQTKGR